MNNHHKLLIIGCSHILADHRASILHALERRGLNIDQIEFREKGESLQGLSADMFIQDDFKLSDEMIKKMEDSMKLIPYQVDDRKPSHPFAKFFQKRIDR